jgi:hypothetical protein
VVSSGVIRLLVARGDIDEARSLLGHDYLIEGPVVSGRGVGKKLGFPTANVEVSNDKIAPFGVWAVKAWLPTGIERKGVLNVGVRPTFGGNGVPLGGSPPFGFQRQPGGPSASVGLGQENSKRKKVPVGSSPRPPNRAGCGFLTKAITAPVLSIMLLVIPMILAGIHLGNMFLLPDNTINDVSVLTDSDRPLAKTGFGGILGE